VFHRSGKTPRSRLFAITGSNRSFNACSESNPLAAQLARPGQHRHEATGGPLALLGEAAGGELNTPLRFGGTTCRRSRTQCVGTAHIPSRAALARPAHRIKGRGDARAGHGQRWKIKLRLEIGEGLAAGRCRQFAG